MVATEAQEPSMKKFYSPEYGFLHACSKDGSLWYNLTDLCNTLAYKLREAEAIIKATKGKIKEMNVRRQKITTCNRFVDEDGLLTLLIECRKNQANGYRKWIEAVVTHSLRNPNESQELELIPTDRELTSYEIRLAYIEQFKRKQKAAKAKPVVTQNLQPSLFANGRVRREDQPQAPGEAPTTTTTVQPRTIATTSVTQAQPQQATNPNPQPFVPADGHMTVEDFFRKEMKFAEFIGHLDGVLKAARQYVRTLSRTPQKVTQQHINVMTTFRGMLKGNADNLKYQPSEAACL